MASLNFDLSPPQRLAVAYAEADLRPALALLLDFDARIADILKRANEPMIAQMKIAWWYDAIARDALARPTGETILRALGEIAMPSLDKAFVKILDSWGGLLAAETWAADVLAEFARIRSDAVFGTYASWAGSADDLSAMGEAWALADLRQRFGNRVECATDTLSPTRITSRKLRALSILAFSVTNPSGFRMIWHALTGR